MKKTLLLILILFALRSEGQVNGFFRSAASNIVELYIFTGQSNALGQPGNTYMSNLPTSLSGVRPNVKIWWEGDYLTVNPANGAFVSMNCPSNTRHPDYTDPSNPYYPQVGFASEQKFMDLVQTARGPSYIIKSAYGGTGISEWFTTSTGNRWIELNRYIVNATAWLEARGKTVVFKGVVWVQYESDILNGTYVPYESRLRTVISNIRAINNKLTNVPFIIIDVHRDAYVGNSGRAVIVSAFDHIVNGTDGTTAVPRCYLLDPDVAGATLQGDFTHYTGDSYVILGQALYSLFVSNGLF